MVGPKLEMGAKIREAVSSSTTPGCLGLIVRVIVRLPGLLLHRGLTAPESGFYNSWLARWPGAVANEWVS